MEDEKKVEEVVKEQAPEAVEGGDEESPVDKANEAADRLEKANKEAAKIAAKQEKILSEIKLQGKSFAGSNPNQKTEEEIKKEKTKEFWKGSEIEKAIEKHG
jgi:hypothetical protein